MESKSKKVGPALLAGDGSERGTSAFVGQRREDCSGSNDESEDGPLGVVGKGAVGHLVGAVDTQISVVGDGGISNDFLTATSSGVVGDGSRGRAEYSLASRSDNKVVGDVLSRTQLFPTSVQNSSVRGEVLSQP
jgi:hypothetical protein